MSLPPDQPPQDGGSWMPAQHHPITGQQAQGQHPEPLHSHPTGLLMSMDPSSTSSTNGFDQQYATTSQQQAPFHGHDGSGAGASGGGGILPASFFEVPFDMGDGHPGGQPMDPSFDPLQGLPNLGPDLFMAPHPQAMDSFDMSTFVPQSTMIPAPDGNSAAGSWSASAPMADYAAEFANFQASLGLDVDGNPMPSAQGLSDAGSSQLQSTSSTGMTAAASNSAEGKPKPKKASKPKASKKDKDAAPKEHEKTKPKKAAKPKSSKSARPKEGPQDGSSVPPTAIATDGAPAVVPAGDATAGAAPETPKPKPKKSKAKAASDATNADGSSSSATKPKKSKKKAAAASTTTTDGAMGVPASTSAATPTAGAAQSATPISGAGLSMPFAAPSPVSTGPWSTATAAPSSLPQAETPSPARAHASKRGGRGSAAKSRGRSASRLSSLGRAGTRDRDTATPAVSARHDSARPGQGGDEDEDDEAASGATLQGRKGGFPGGGGGGGAGAATLGGATGGNAEDDEAEDDADAEQEGEDELRSGDFENQERIYAAQQRSMGLLSMVMSDSQLDRHMASRRGALNKSSVRKLVNHVLSQSVNAHVAMVTAGVAKVFVGEIVESARRVQQQRNEAGALRPIHLYEAYRLYRMERERPGLYPPGTRGTGSAGMGKRRRLF